MKSHLLAAVAVTLAFSGVAMATPADDAKSAVEAQSTQSENERAGLPDLAAINNQPAAHVTSKVDINDVPRTPSFHEVTATAPKSPNTATRASPSKSTCIRISARATR